MIVTDGVDLGRHSQLGAELRAKVQQHRHEKHIWGVVHSAPYRLGAKKLNWKMMLPDAYFRQLAKTKHHLVLGVANTPKNDPQ